MYRLLIVSQLSSDYFPIASLLPPCCLPFCILTLFLLSLYCILPAGCPEPTTFILLAFGYFRLLFANFVTFLPTCLLRWAICSFTNVILLLKFKALLHTFCHLQIASRANLRCKKLKNCRLQWVTYYYNLFI